jgi:hypothetical protein
VYAVAVVIIAGQAWVAHSLRLHPVWLFPLISTVLLAASIAVYEARDEPGLLARVLSHALNVVLVIANAVSLVLLVRGVFLGSSLRPTGLLFAGLALWLVNLGVFALLFWELDGGGPEARADGYVDSYPDFVFPQQQADQQGLAPAAWKPGFYDYVYLSLTSSIAFSPTDAMPYSKGRAAAGPPLRESAPVASLSAPSLAAQRRHGALRPLSRVSSSTRRLRLPSCPDACSSRQTPSDAPTRSCP